MKSTAENPFAFLEWYFEKQIEKDLKEFYINITEELYFNNVDEVDKTTHSVKVLNIHHKDEINSEYLTFTFESSIKSKLNAEIQNTINLIEQQFQKRFSDKNEVKAYADFLRIKIRHIESFKTTKEFSFLNNHLAKIEDTINRYSVDVKHDLENLTSIDIKNKSSQKDENDRMVFKVGQEEELIQAVFGFMSGHNQKREKIMNDEQFDLMIDYIKELVFRERLPNVISRLSRVKISNDLLSFSFWVLHEQLYTTSNIKGHFIEFLKLVFENFENREISSIKKGFGTKARVPYDDFIPKIIKQYL